MTTASKKNIWTIVKFIVPGFLLIWAVFRLIDTGVRHSNREQLGKVNKIVNHTVDSSIIVFGSSVSEVGIDPSVLGSKTGLSAFNCSLNGTRFMQYKGLIDEFNSYSKNNRYVILVETYFSFEKADALTFTENFLAQINNPNVYNALYSIQPDLIWKCRYVPFYKYIAVSHIYYKHSITGWKNLLSKHSQDDGLTGYDPVDRNWEADADEAIRNTPKFDVQVDSAVEFEYVKTIKALQKSGKKVIIVLTPMYTEMLKRITDISPLRKELKKISAEQSARFLDFSQSALCDHKEYFYNSNHLNKAGSQQFSALLGDSLRSLIYKDGRPPIAGR